MEDRTYRGNAIVVGAGLAGLVAATELADAGRRALGAADGMATEAA